MSTNRNVVNLSVAIVKILVKMAGFGCVADMIEGSQECLNLLADIKNDALGNPNAEMIRALNGAINSELHTIQEALQRAGLSREQIKHAVAQLSDAACQTIKELAEDDNALIRAIQQPEHFIEDLKSHAAPLPDDLSTDIQDHYETLLDQIAEKFLTLAPWSPSFDRVALTSLLRCFPALSERIDRLEQHMDRRFDHIELGMRVDRDIHIENNQLLKGLSRQNASPIFDHVVFGSRPDVVAGDSFVPRGEQEQLSALIADPTQRRTVLMGMRGCGKTQLAASLAEQREEANWNLVAWINAVSPNTIQSDLVELAKRLKIDTSDQPAQDVIVRRCLDHLKSAAPTDRLIVFDNVEDINHLTGLIPSGDGVRVVATTTNKVGWEDQGWNSIKVGVFDRSESINYLLRVTKSDDHDAADALAERLGDLPLAIAQAAATARNDDLSLVQYLDRLDSYRSERVIRPVPGDYYTDDVATALCMAIEDALENLKDGTEPAARHLLGALALLAESGVPTRWLDPTIEYLDDRGRGDANQAADEDAHDALTELVHRSIVQQSVNKATTMLHRLQAQAFRESWAKNESTEAYEAAAIALGKVFIGSFPRNNTNSRHRETLDLIEQLRAIGEQPYSRQLLEHTQMLFILNYALAQAYELDLSQEAITLSSTVHLLAEQYSANTEGLLTLYNNLAVVYHSAGYLDVAISMYEDNLKRSIDCHGTEHLNTLEIRSNLLYAYRTVGRLDEAITQSEQLIAYGTKTLGADHPLLLTVRNNLASCYELCGQLDRAINLYEQVLDSLVRVQGSHDPKTLATRNNLASAYQSYGRLEDAINLYAEVVTIATSILGENHPNTLTWRNNLAQALQIAGRIDEAIPHFAKLLAGHTCILGDEHPDTLAAGNNLALACAIGGDFPEAIKRWERIYATSKRILGEAHPFTATVRENLEAAKRELERQEEESAAE